MPLTDFDHLEILFTDPAFWAHEILWHVLPERSWRNIRLLATLRFVVDVATDNALPLPHRVRVGKNKVANLIWGLGQR